MKTWVLRIAMVLIALGGAALFAEAQSPGGLGISLVSDGITTLTGLRQMLFTGGGAVVTSGGNGTGIVNVAIPVPCTSTNPCPGSALNFAIGPGTTTKVAAGSGYAVGDSVTLACPGVTFTTSPIIGIDGVSAGSPNLWGITNPGVATAGIPLGAVTCTQASTTGSGTGFTVSASFGVIAAYVNQMTFAGTQGAGNFYLGLGTPSATQSGAENTFVGTYAGAGFGNGSSNNTAVGLNACGLENGTLATTANNNTCIGDDSMRNITGSSSGNTAVGVASLRVIGGGSNNTGLGYEACQVLTTGNDNTCVGEGTGAAMVTGQFNIIMGYGAAPVLTSGDNNIIIGFQSAPTNLQTGGQDILIGYQCDTTGAAVNYEIHICMSSGDIWSMTGGATPSTSTTKIAGYLDWGGNCSSAASPAVCGAAANGSVAMPTGAVPTLVVDTTAVTANSQILLTIDESLGTKLSVTCNTTLATLVQPVVTARTAGTSFTITMNATLATNPACISYTIVN